MSVHPVAKSLAAALSNDPRGVVSASDARAIVEQAIAGIGRSDDPQATFTANQRFVAAAAALLGTSKNAPAALASYAQRGPAAVAERLRIMAGQPVLPSALRRELVETLDAYAIVGGDGEITLTKVRGNERDGYAVDFSRGTQGGTAYATRFGEAWVLSPKPIDAATLELAQKVALEYFDSEWAPELRNDWGLGEREVSAMRERVVPTRVMFGGEDTDPHGLIDTHPLVLQFSNPTESDHGFYVAVDPESRTGEAYTFN